jgi:hypothetical protein
MLDRFYELRHRIKQFLSECNPSVDNFNWRLKAVFPTDITGKLRDVQTRLQGENTLIPKMANTVFSLKIKFNESRRNLNRLRVFNKFSTSIY